MVDGGWFLLIALFAFFESFYFLWRPQINFRDRSGAFSDVFELGEKVCCQRNNVPIVRKFAAE